MGKRVAISNKSGVTGTGLQGKDNRINRVTVLLPSRKDRKNHEGGHSERSTRTETKTRRHRCNLAVDVEMWRPI